LLNQSCESRASRDVFTQYFHLSDLQICGDVGMLQFISQENHACHASVRYVCFELNVFIFWFLMNLQFVVILSV